MKFAVHCACEFSDLCTVYTHLTTTLIHYYYLPIGYICRLGEQEDSAERFTIG
jgi:hypothetical protein